MPVKWWFVILTFMVLIFGFFLGMFLGGEKRPGPGPKTGSNDGGGLNLSNPEYEGVITKVADGFTIDIDDRRVRLVLLEPVGIDDPKFLEAIRFTSTMCPVGSKARFKVDEGNPVDDLGRTLGVVHCGDRNLNAELVKEGFARIDEELLSSSEFDPDEW